jgi:uncharacterized lipoprotein YajG
MTSVPGAFRRKRLLAIFITSGTVAVFSFFLSACSYGPAPPILIPPPMAPSVQKRGMGESLEVIYLLPTQLPENMTDVGTLFKLNGNYSALITDKPLGPSLDSILLRQFRASGLNAKMAMSPSHAVTLQLFVKKFEDKVKEKLLNTQQSGKIEMEAIMILHSDATTRTVTRTMERHRSPSSTISFDKSDPSVLLGGLFSDAVTKDLIPYIKKKIGESP